MGALQRLFRSSSSAGAGRPWHKGPTTHYYCYTVYLYRRGSCPDPNQHAGRDSFSSTSRKIFNLACPLHHCGIRRATNKVRGHFSKVHKSIKEAFRSDYVDTTRIFKIASSQPCSSSRSGSPTHTSCSHLPPWPNLAGYIVHVRHDRDARSSRILA